MFVGSLCRENVVCSDFLLVLNWLSFVVRVIDSRGPSRSTSRELLGAGLEEGLGRRGRGNVIRYTGHDCDNGMYNTCLYTRSTFTKRRLNHHTISHFQNTWYTYTICPHHGSKLGSQLRTLRCLRCQFKSTTQFSVQLTYRTKFVHLRMSTTRYRGWILSHDFGTCTNYLRQRYCQLKGQGLCSGQFIWVQQFPTSKQPYYHEKSEHCNYTQGFTLLYCRGGGS